MALQGLHGKTTASILSNEDDNQKQNSHTCAVYKAIVSAANAECLFAISAHSST